MDSSKGTTRFKSRFSIFSLLPSRHPPLAVSHPMPPTKPVPRHATVVSKPVISPVESQYPEPSTPLPPPPPPNASPARRPPPLDLGKTKAAFPSFAAIVTQPSAKSKPVMREEEAYEYAEVEVGHRYPSWKGGKVDIMLGEVVPQGLLQVYNPTPSLKTAPVATPDAYDCVLYNVLLTPTYLHASPYLPDTPSPIASSSRKDRLNKAESSLPRAAKRLRDSRWLAAPKAWEIRANRSICDLREREGQRMETFRKAVTLAPLGMKPSHSTVIGPGERERNSWERTVYSSEKSGRVRTSSAAEMAWESSEKSWRDRARDEGKAKRKLKIWKYSIAIAILCLAALTIGLCTSLLTGSNKSSSTATTIASASASMASPTTTGSSASPSSVSQTLSSCLAMYNTTTPSSYPCAACVPVLSSTANDFLAPLVNGNATGVGAALQLCALMDIFSGTRDEQLSNGGWGNDTNYCGRWSGVACDSRGRVTTLQLKYPGVPDELPTTLANLVGLQELHLIGNSTIPMGAFPSALFSLPSLNTLDMESTALTGPLATEALSNATALTELYLTNNHQMGTTLPSLASSTKLLTLAVTGQGLTNVSAGDLPSSITYLDLSYNSLSGQILSLGQMTALTILYLEKNAFTSPPDSLPSSLTTLSLTGNPGLKGSLPRVVCDSTGLTSCDLRNTGLSGTPTSNTTENPTTASKSVEASSTSTACGVCQFS
ncbi:hypothetical protein P7C73_g533, partial [Tremellales sp. Uapishka_1]